MKDNLSSPQNGNDLLQNLKRKLIFFQILSALLAILFAFCATCISLETPMGQSILRLLKRKVQPPAYFEIKKILFPLVYSSIEDLAKPDVRMIVDFEHQTWTLLHFHHFDENQNVVLEQNRYGLCGAQADYIARQIRPHLGGAYKIEFMRALETNYFFDPKASIHYVLRLTNRTIPAKEYIIDTVFNRYGPVQEFDDYVFSETADHLEFTPDVTLGIGNRMALTIQKDFILSLSLDVSDGQFDSNHFLFSLEAFGKHKLLGKTLFAIRFVNGEMEYFEDKEFAEEILSTAEFMKIKNIMYSLLKNMSAGIPETPPTIRSAS